MKDPLRIPTQTVLVLSCIAVLLGIYFDDMKMERVGFLGAVCTLVTLFFVCSDSTPTEDK